MQLTRQTDYALRLLIFLARSEARRTQIAEVADAQAISHAHLMKIANKLAHAGFIEAVRGRGGGISLARRPCDINLGDVVRVTEPECPMVDCAGCRLIHDCDLPGILDEASAAFRSVLARYSLANLLRTDGVATDQPPVFEKAEEVSDLLSRARLSASNGTRRSARANQ